MEQELAAVAFSYLGNPSAPVLGPNFAISDQDVGANDAVYPSLAQPVAWPPQVPPVKRLS